LRIVFYISGHGFGHASRDVELIKTIAAKERDTRFVVRTTIPAWLFERIQATLDVQPLETDTGLIQIDSLRFDEQQTVLRAATFYRTFEQRADLEAGVIKSLGADLVVGDIPPVAFAAAGRAGVQSVALGNFTWDWIYSSYPAFTDYAPEVIPAIRAAYATATRALRLPFHGGFEPMAPVTEDIPLIAMRSRRDPAETRRLLGIPADRPFVLASFGAYGASLPYDAIRATGQFTLVNVERFVPHGLEYQDLVAAADVVVSKPGYGIVSECIANKTALLYTSRGNFIEYDLFVNEMPRVVRCRFISQEDLFAGRWADAISSVLDQPDPPERARVDGAEVAASIILSSIART
jgi:UDP:flavonoid glycosyltransferase YjiC (YdhE family)